MKRFNLILFSTLLALILNFSVEAAKNSKLSFGTIFIEAENAKVKDYCKIISDKEASGEKTVLLGSKTDRDISSPTSSNRSAIEYYIDVDHAAVFKIWVRVKSDKENTKMWICVDKDEYSTFSCECKDKYTWCLAISKYLLPGEHTIKIMPYNKGVYFDELSVTRKTGPPIGTSEINDKVSMEAISYDTISWNIVDSGVGRLHLQSKNEWQEPDVKPIPEHPRLYFTKSDIPRILENVTKPQNASAWELHKQFAETDEEDISLEIIEAKALDYALRNNRKAGERAVKEAIMFFEKTGRGYTQLTSGDPYNIIGQSIYTLSAVYDWCYDLLTPEQKDYIIDEMIMLGSKMEVGWPPKSQNAITTHGAEAQIQRDYLSMAIAVYDERPDIYNYIASRLFNEFVEYRKWIYKGHEIANQKANLQKNLSVG